MPADIVSAAVNHASTPLAYSYGNYEKVLATACALVRKQEIEKKGEEIKMELDNTNKDRSYLFGRLLAVSEKVEQMAMYSAYRNKGADASVAEKAEETATYSNSGSENRETNAKRLQASYVNRPLRTWGILETALIPYYRRLSKGSENYYKDVIEEIISSLSEEDETILNKSLDATYLLGYYLQRKELKKSKKSKNSETTIDKEEKQL